MKAGKLAAVALRSVLPYHVAMPPESPLKRQGTTWFVSRHPGAIAWAKTQGLAIDRWTPHLATADVGKSDTVIGTLPVNLAAAVCEKGARYLHLSLHVPAEWRGRELSLKELQGGFATLKEFHIKESR